MTSQLPPKVRYNSTVYAEEVKNGQSSADTLAVNNAIKVIVGTLDSVLHLIGYSFLQIKQINRQLAIKYQTHKKSEFDLSYFENQISDELKNGRPTRAHIVEWDNCLYGVIIDEGRARICGQICTTIPKTVNSYERPIIKRGIRVTRGKTGKTAIHELTSETEVRQLLKSGKHFVIVSEKGSVFVVPKIGSSGQSGQSGHDKNLILILGHGFVVIDDSDGTPVHWVRTKQELREQRRESTPLEPNQSIVVSFAAVCIEDRVINVYGSGSVVNFEAIQKYYLPIN